jgi:hypothetical protein
MATKSKKRKVKRKVSVSTKAKFRKKSEQPKDTLKKAPVKTVLPTNGITFKVKIRKK